MAKRTRQVVDVVYGENSFLAGVSSDLKSDCHADNMLICWLNLQDANGTQTYLVPLGGLVAEPRCKSPLHLDVRLLLKEGQMLATDDEQLLLL